MLEGHHEKPTYENVEDWLVHPQKDQKDYPFLDKNNGLMRAWLGYSRTSH